MAGNPILARAEKDAVNSSGTASGQAYPQAAGYPPPPPPPPGAPVVQRPTRTMTIDDVVVKTGITFVILLIGAAIGWQFSGAAMLVPFVSMFIAFVLALFISFKKVSSPPLVILYSVFEGVFLGGISRWYQAYGEANGNGNLVAQAVGATLVVFAVMLVVYKTGMIKVTQRTMKVFFVMLISYAVIGLISLITALFGLGGGWGFYGVTGIGILLSLFAVGLASFSLVIDFDGIVRMSAYGVDEKESWRMAFGLMVSLVWLYLEILRLLAIVNRS